MMNENKKCTIIAFYLPQYHPTVNNDLWWGKGFTEWTNVAKAKKLYPGHYQPKIPADLGFYDLRISEVRKEQADLARKAGVDAFCYYHYWFGNGKQELELPFKEVINLGEPDFPFCLCWANESWHSKFWNKDGSSTNNLLIEQEYLGSKDNEEHFYSLLKAFKDSRYLKFNGKLIFVIYKPLLFENCKEFMSQWNELALKNGLQGFHFIGQTGNKKYIEQIKDVGFDAINLLRLYDVSTVSNSIFIRYWNYFLTRVINRPFVYSYKRAINYFVGEEDKLNYVYPTLIPNWDHTPRSKNGGYVLDGSTPELFSKHANMVIENVKTKPDKENLIFLKSWNEWGEGNYMEPDLKFGSGYINAQRNIIDSFN